MTTQGGGLLGLPADRRGFGGGVPRDIYLSTPLSFPFLPSQRPAGSSPDVRHPPPIAPSMPRIVAGATTALSCTNYAYNGVVRVVRVLPGKRSVVLYWAVLGEPFGLMAGSYR